MIQQFNAQTHSYFYAYITKNEYVKLIKLILGNFQIILQKSNKLLSIISKQLQCFKEKFYYIVYMIIFRLSEK